MSGLYQNLEKIGFSLQITKKAKLHIANQGLALNMVLAIFEERFKSQLKTRYLNCCCKINLKRLIKLKSN